MMAQLPGHHALLITPPWIFSFGGMSRTVPHFVDGQLWSMGGSPGELSEELVTQENQKMGWRMNCDVGKATEGLENEL